MILVSFATDGRTHSVHRGDAMSYCAVYKNLSTRLPPFCRYVYLFKLFKLWVLCMYASMELLHASGCENASIFLIGQ
jgi:hypothetical protein